MKNRFGWTSLVCMMAVVCAALLWPTISQAIPQEKDKAHDIRVGDGLKIESKLTTDDARDKKHTDSYCKVFLVKMTKDKLYTIRMNAQNQQEIDTVLRVEDAQGKELAYNDDAVGEKTLNSCINFYCKADGVYRVITTSLNENDTGNFTLLIKLANQ